MKTPKLISLLIIGTILLGFYSCKKIDLPKGTPACIESKIRKISRQKVFNPPAIVALWEFEGKNYYYFTSDCCDQFSTLYDEDCNVVCHPDGGLTGMGDGKCPDFSNGIIKKSIIWQDKR